MIRLIKQIAPALCIALLFTSCGMFGIHFKVHNPKRAGKYPKFDKETILLGELTPIRNNFDVTFYDLDIDINPDNKTLGGWVEIKATTLSTIDSIQIDLDQQLLIEELRWGARDGHALAYVREQRAIFIKTPNALAKGDVFSLHVKYHGKPIIAKRPPWEGGLVWKKDKEGNPWIGVACETQGSSIWFPCKDHTSDEPDSAYMHFTIPDKGLMAISNGQFMGSEKKEDKIKFSWKVTYPINLYNITFYVGNFVKIEDTYVNGKGKELKLTHYVLKPNAAKASQHFKQVKKHIAAYEELYGEYQWYNDGFKLVESPYAGMEHQSAIAYGNGYKNDLQGGKEDYIILHETGHEWFGNAISAADFADVWLQEGFTTYGEALYLEKTYGIYAAYSHLLFYRWTIKNKRPVVGPYNKRYFDYHDSDVYVKGAWILHTLRNQLNNDTLFFNILKTFYEENKLKTTDSKQFIETVNRISGENYNWFFDQYLYKHKVPFLEYQYTKSGDVYYRWTEVADDFNKLKVPFSFLGDDMDLKLTPTTKVQKYTIETNTLPKEIRFSNRKALFGIKENNKLEKVYQMKN